MLNTRMSPYICTFLPSNIFYTYIHLKSLGMSTVVKQVFYPIKSPDPFIFIFILF